MITCTSISGGQTSAYLAKNYPADINIFALVRVDEIKCKFPDRKLAQRVEDRIQKPFVGTVEDDTIIHTIFDLEQYIGDEIVWVSGPTFDNVVDHQSRWLPNALHRFCTSEMKVFPIAQWLMENIKDTVEMQIGYRANELNRAATMEEKTNKNGIIEVKLPYFTNTQTGRKKWKVWPYMKPKFPLIQDHILKHHISKFWVGKPVRFAAMNNCVGCFHRNPILLRKMYDLHPEKMEWFASKETVTIKGKQRKWRSDLMYKDIFKHSLQIEIGWDDFSACDSGYCGL